jgi:hypothetical protein
MKNSIERGFPFIALIFLGIVLMTAEKPAVAHKEEPKRLEPKVAQGAAHRTAFAKLGKAPPPNYNEFARGAALLRSGPYSRLRLQPPGGEPGVSGGSEARFQLRHVLLGAGPRPWTQHQRADEF